MGDQEIACPKNERSVNKNAKMKSGNTVKDKIMNECIRKELKGQQFRIRWERIDLDGFGAK